MHAARYTTSLPRAALGLTAGAITGAGLVVLWHLWESALGFGLSYALTDGVRQGTTIFAVALAVWTVGLIALGLPLWWLLHRRGWRHWAVAAAAGAALTFVAFLGMQTRLFDLLPPPADATYSASDAGGPTVIDNRRTAHGWWVAFEAALAFGAGGIPVALVVWRIAYRRADRAPEPAGKAPQTAA